MLPRRAAEAMAAEATKAEERSGSRKLQLSLEVRLQAAFAPSHPGSGRRKQPLVHAGRREHAFPAYSADGTWLLRPPAGDPPPRPAGEPWTECAVSAAQRPSSTAILRAPL